MKTHRIFLVAFVISSPAIEDSAKRPNLIVIIDDDLGYADVGFNGCTDIPTPHLDSLAKHGVRCTNGYVSHPFCSPTRAALMAGHYQHRFGHKNNQAWLPKHTAAGLPVDQITLPLTLQKASYETATLMKTRM